MPDEKKHRALKPDAQAFDEVRIVTVPRFKTSGLSGNEWRISARIDFYRNGVKVHEAEPYRNVETALDFAKAEWHRAIDNGNGLFAGDSDFCDQEGCSDKRTETFVLGKLVCKSCSSEKEALLGQEYRKFCQIHAERGDSDLEDNDKNYTKEKRKL